MIQLFLFDLVKRVCRPARSRRRPAVRPSCRPRLQVLEDRTVPTTVLWTNPAGGDWSVASNWSTGTLPGPNDDVVIDSPISGATITRGSGATDSIHSLTVHGNALTFTNGSLSIAADSSTDGDFILSGGTLSLGGTFETSCNSQWRNATVQGAGSWVNDGTLSILPQGIGTTLQTVLRNNGSIVETGFLTLGAGGDLQNTAAGYYDFAADGSIFANGNGRFDNAGTLQKTAGNPNIGSTIQGGNVLGGTVDAEVGRILFDSTGGALMDGTFIAAAGAFVDIGNLSQSPGSTLVNGSFTGSGAGSVSLIGNLNVGQTGATFDFPGSTLVWGNATIDGGSAGFTNLGNMRQTSNVNHPLRGLFVNDGTLVQTGIANLQLSASAVLSNEAGAVYNVQGDGGIFGPNGSPNSATFNNTGTLQKSGGTGTSLVNLSLDNAGTVAVNSGTLNAEGAIAQLAGSVLLGGTWDVSGNASLLLAGPPITTNAATIQLSGPGANFANLSGLTSNTGTLLLVNGQSLTTPANLVNSGTVSIDATSALTVGQNYTQRGGLTELAGGTLATATVGNNVYIYGGLLSGFGIIQANVTNDGEVRVELGGTGLAITGVYIQGSDGTLDLAVGGYNAGTDYSVLQIGGFASLAGTLNVSLANGFVPAAGDSFGVLTSAQVAGDFATEQGLDLGNGLAFVPVLDATSLTLTTVAS
jgi:hypothetical protein